MGKAGVQSHYTVVQALRGVASLWVVLFHLSEGGHLQSLRRTLPADVYGVIFDAGHFGVPIFFALSGFVIAHSLSGAKITLVFFGRFIVRRSIRLDPAYWAAIAAAIAFAALSAVVKGAAIATPSFENLLAHVFYAQVMTQQPEINSAFWTLTFEVQFYLFFVGLLAVRTYLQQVKPVIGSLFFASGLMSAAGAFDQLPAGIFLPLWSSFYIGVLAIQAINSRLHMAGLVVLAGFLVNSGGFGCASALTALFLFMSVRFGWAQAMFNWGWLQTLGAVSYSLYLVHSPITGAVSFLCVKALGSGLAGNVTALILSVALSIAGAWLLWTLVERPTHRLAKTLGRAESRQC